MPNLRRREQADNAELQAVVDQSVDRTAYLRLAETLATFLTRLRSSAGALDGLERQRVLRLLVKEILVGDDKIIIRHCIPLPMAPGDGPPAGSADAALPAAQSYLLRSRSHDSPLRGSSWSLESLTLCLVAPLQHLLNELQHAAVGDLLSEESHKFLVTHAPQELFQLPTHHPLVSTLPFPPTFA